MDRARLLSALSMGLLVLTVPAGRTCLEFARMAENCPMASAAARSESAATREEPAPHHMGHAAPAAASAAALPGSTGAARASESPCHEGGMPAADCCRDDTRPAKIEGLLSASLDPTASWGALAGVPAISPVELQGSEAMRSRRAPPPEAPLYRLLSSYLL